MRSDFQNRKQAQCTISESSSNSPLMVHNISLKFQYDNVIAYWSFSVRVGMLQFPVFVIGI